MNRCDVAFVRKVGFRQRALLGLDVFESSPKQLIQVLNRIAALLDRVAFGFNFMLDRSVDRLALLVDRKNCCVDSIFL